MTLKEETSLSSNNMEKLFRDSQDRLWVTTGGGGLNLYDEKMIISIDLISAVVD